MTEFKEYLGIVKEGETLNKAYNIFSLVGDNYVDINGKMTKVPVYTKHEGVLEVLPYEEYKSMADEVFAKLGDADKLCSEIEEEENNILEKKNDAVEVFNGLVSEYEEFEYLNDEDKQSLEEETLEEVSEEED